MKTLIVANWKMNPTSQDEAEKLFDDVKKGIKSVKSEVVICPPFVYLAKLKGLTLGAQNVFWKEEGAFTGAISGKMLKDLGVEYVIIGHSESRRYLKETDEIINRKIKEALEVGLKVIFCIGETLEEKNNGKKEEILERQIRIGLDGIGNWKLEIENLAIAYEPIWAIGTGNNCSTEDAKESVNFIRKFVKESMKILYGGSVNSENASSYIKDAEFNGLLVGGASLNPEEFIEIVKSVE